MRRTEKGGHRRGGRRGTSLFVLAALSFLSLSAPLHALAQRLPEAEHHPCQTVTKTMDDACCCDPGAPCVSRSEDRLQGHHVAAHPSAATWPPVVASPPAGAAGPADRASIRTGPPLFIVQQRFLE